MISRAAEIVNGSISCSFEIDLCDWTSVESDTDIKWRIGPINGSGGGTEEQSFAYAETDGQTKGTTAHLLSAPVEASNISDSVLSVQSL